MAKAAAQPAQPDVLVLGSHPCAFFAAALLRQNSAIRVTRADVPDEVLDDRLVAINPELFDLHPLLTPLKKKLELTPVYGLRFLADDPSTSSEFVSKSIAVYVTGSKSLRQAMHKLADDNDVQQVANESLEVRHVDDAGIHVMLDGREVMPKLLIAAAELPRSARRPLGLPENWDPGVLHRYSYIKCKGTRGMEFNGSGDGGAGNKALMPMSLDLQGQLKWAWVLPGPGAVQFAVEHVIDNGSVSTSATSTEQLMQHWLNVLTSHGVLKSKDMPELKTMVWTDLPFAGALAQEDVANRTLLIGPAGGFYTACAEDIYPCCWSALFAADTVKKALKEKHPQDALQIFRHKWGATLGDYLRGPQQNLRFLLPLVYRNKMMTARLSEAILFGKSVVR